MKIHPANGLRKGTRGFSLAELMVAVALFTLFGGIVFVLSEAAVQLYAKNLSLMLCEWTARKAVNKIRPDIERSTAQFTALQRFQLLDGNGNLLPANSQRYGLGIRIAVTERNNPNAVRLIAYLVVNGEELRYYPEATTIAGAPYQVLTDNLVAPTSVGEAGTRDADYPFHFTSNEPDGKLVDVNLKVRARSYDRFVSRSTFHHDLENPNTFFQIRATAGGR